MPLDRRACTASKFYITCTLLFRMLNPSSSLTFSKICKFPPRGHPLTLNVVQIWSGPGVKKTPRISYLYVYVPRFGISFGIVGIAWPQLPTLRDASNSTSYLLFSAPGGPDSGTPAVKIGRENFTRFAEKFVENLCEPSPSFPETRLNSSLFHRDRHRYTVMYVRGIYRTC